MSLDCRTSIPLSAGSRGYGTDVNSFLRLGLVLLGPASRGDSPRRRPSGADPTLSNDSAKIRSGNGANPTPDARGSERAPRALAPADLQDALSISAPAPSYTISGARWNIAFKSNQDYSRIASPVSGARGAEGAEGAEGGRTGASEPIAVRESARGLFRAS